MPTSIFYGGSLVAALIAGAIALFAPCSISVMLPAYFASSFQNRRVLVAMTFVYAAGIATVILPLTIGASILRQVFVEGHRPIYIAGGLLMVALALYTLLGGQLHLPMPGRRAGRKTGALSVYSLGAFSGVATSCCAPVLAGVIALSGATTSFLLALGLGVAYVYGMVTPLFLIALFWEQVDWRASRLFRPRSFRWRLSRFSGTLTATTLASTLLLTTMGIASLWIGLTSSSMPAPSGWQAELTVRLQRAGRIISDALRGVPGWAAALMLTAATLVLAWYALKQLKGSAPLSRTDELVEATPECAPHERTSA